MSPAGSLLIPFSYNPGPSQTLSRLSSSPRCSRETFAWPSLDDFHRLVLTFPLVLLFGESGLFFSCRSMFLFVGAVFCSHLLFYFLSRVSGFPQVPTEEFFPGPFLLFFWWWLLFCVLCFPPPLFPVVAFPPPPVYFDSGVSFFFLFFCLYFFCVVFFSSVFSVLAFCSLILSTQLFSVRLPSSYFCSFSFQPGPPD